MAFLYCVPYSISFWNATKSGVTTILTLRYCKWIFFINWDKKLKAKPCLQLYWNKFSVVPLKLPNSAILIQKSFVSNCYAISIIMTGCCCFLFQIHGQWVHAKVLNKQVLTDLAAVLQDITAPTCPPCTILLLKVTTCEAKQDLCSHQPMSGLVISW